jgi:hypothetical protein
VVVGLLASSVARSERNLPLLPSIETLGTVLGLLAQDHRREAT